MHNDFIFRSVSFLHRISGKGKKVMEDIIVGTVAAALIVYLFIALLRPEKF